MATTISHITYLRWLWFLDSLDALIFPRKSVFVVVSLFLCIIELSLSLVSLCLSRISSKLSVRLQRLSECHAILNWATWAFRICGVRQKWNRFLDEKMCTLLDWRLNTKTGTIWTLKIGTRNSFSCIALIIDFGWKCVTNFHKLDTIFRCCCASVCIN